MTRTQALALVSDYTCTWQCLQAREVICVCRCGGKYHGECKPRPKYRVLLGDDGRVLAYWKPYEHPDHAHWPPRDGDGKLIMDIAWWPFCRDCEAEHDRRKARIRQEAA